MSVLPETIWRRFATVLLVVSVVSLAAGAVLGTFVAGAEMGFDGSDTGVHGVSQKNPGELTATDGLSAYERQLAERLASRARQASINVSSGDIERARSLLNGTEYESLLTASSDLSDEGPTGSGIRTVVRSNRLLANYTTIVAAYWDAYRNYSVLRNTSTIADLDRPVVYPPIGVGGRFGHPREQLLYTELLARNMSVTEYRRTAARRLISLQRRANTTGTTLLSLYRNSSVLGSDNKTSVRAIRSSLENITERTRRVRETVFAGTALTVDARSRRISAVDPLNVTGRLTLENGTALSGHRISLRIGGVERSVTTNETGAFSLTYQPVGLSPNVSTIRLRYVPNATEPYAGAEQTLNVTVERTKPTITIEPPSDPVRYGHSIPLTGSVRADGVGIPDVAVVASVNGQYLNRTNTSASGRFAFDASLPAEVQSGEATVSVRVLGANTSIVSTNATASLSVETSETVLSIAVSGTDDGTARVSGTLRLQDGTPVVGQRITLLGDGERLSTVRTAADGSFETTVSLPDGAVQSGILGGEVQVSLTARYDPSGGNLAPSRASATVVVTTGSSLPLIVGAGLIVVALAGAAFVASRRDRDAPQSSKPDTVDDEGVSKSPSEDVDRAWLLELAREKLADGSTEQAVRASYAAVRHGLESTLTDDQAGTHWEFYRRCRDDGVDGVDVEALRELTRLYERAVFADGTVSADGGADAVALADGLVDGAAHED